MGYSLSLLPHWFGTPDRLFSKTNEVSMMHFMMEDHSEAVKYFKESMFLLDGRAFLHTMINLVPTFEGIAF